MATRTTANRNANLDVKISHPLERLRGLIRLFVALDVLLFAGLFFVIWFLSWIAFDYGVFKGTGIDYALYSHWGLRAAFIGVMLAILAAYATLRITRLIRKDLSYPSLAMVLEKRHPELLRDRLITAIELSDLDKAEAQGYSREMVQHTIDEAHERMGRVNVRGVFRWGRLRTKVIVASAILLLCAGAGFGAHALGTKSFQPQRAVHKIADVCTIWGERNLLMRNTPWPRRSHIELVGFPESGELRQGKDAGAPRIRARDYRWVIADRDRVEGWRPLRVSDLNRPEFGIAPVNLSAVAVVDAGKTTTVDLSDATLDDVEGQLTAKHELVQDTFTKLDELADDVWMTRTLRKLVKPEGMILTFTGTRSGGSSNLTPEPNGEYTCEVNGIKENRVSFVVRGEDYRTPPKFIELIPPPMLIELYRNEYQPAYLYYPAPIDTGDKAHPLAILRGKKQLFAEQKISLTSEKSIFPVPTGTDVDIFAKADKPLRKVAIAPKGETKKLWEKNLPGDGFTKTAVGWEKSDDAGFTDFGLRFRDDDAIRELVEFEYTLTDLDGVTAKRSITIQVNEDQPPQVEVAVDVLRKVGNSYMCTPIAMIPFVAESRIADDTGLSRVDYEYTYTKVESSVVSTLQAQVAGGMVGAFGGPVRSFGTVGAIAGNRIVFEQVGSKAEQKQFGSAPVLRFTDEYGRLTRDTLTKLEQTLAANADRNAPRGVVKQIKFSADNFDYFDLKANLTTLPVPESEIQPRYKIELNVTATDSNTELVGRDGKPLVNRDGTPLIGKKSSNVEPIRLLIVSEADLLNEISKDEENQSVKLDEILKRIAECESKLSQELGLLGAPSKNQISSSAVRALDILQDVNKSKDQLMSVLVDFERIYREIETNRCNPKLLEKYRTAAGEGIIPETKRILDGTSPIGSFPQAESALGTFQVALNGGQLPAPPEIDAARTQLGNLRLALTKLRSISKSIVEIGLLRKELQDLIDQQRFIAGGLKKVFDDATEEVRRPAITANRPIEVQVGKTVTVKHGIDFKLYDQGQLLITIVPPAGSDLILPKDVVAKDDAREFAYDVTAGMKPGNYTLQIKPFVGKTVDQQIIVTK